MRQNNKERLFYLVNKLNPEFKTINEQMAITPIESDKLTDIDIDRQILRSAIISELDAISLYEQLSSNTKNDKLKKILLDVAKEEKTHVGEFQAMLIELDSEQKTELKTGEDEIKNIQ